MFGFVVVGVDVIVFGDVGDDFVDVFVIFDCGVVFFEIF